MKQEHLLMKTRKTRTAHDENTGYSHKADRGDISPKKASFIARENAS